MAEANYYNAKNPAEDDEYKEFKKKNMDKLISDD